MNYFLYHIPGPAKTVVEESMLIDLNLLDSIGDCSYAAGGVTKGPGGQGGMLFAAYVKGEAPPDPKLIRYIPNDQIWTKCAKGALWIGYWKTKKPSEQDLFRRQNGYRGHGVRLADGNEWVIPALYLASGVSAVPCSILRNEDGVMISEPLEKYRKVVDLAYKFFSYSCGTGDIPYVEALELSEMVLSMNYMVGMWELRVLNLFTSDNLLQCGLAVIDMPERLKYLEKLEEATKNEVPFDTAGWQSTDSGVKEDYKVTDQHSLTSGSSEE